MRLGRAARGRRRATRHGSRGPRTGSTRSTCAGRARRARNGLPSATRSASTCFVEAGVVWFAHREDGFETTSLATLREMDVPAERIAIDEAARRWPQVSFDDVAFAVLEPESGLLMARRSVAAVARRVAELGGASEVAERATRPGRGLAPHRRRARRRPAARGGAVRVRLRPVAADAVPRGRGRSHRGHQAGRGVRGASAPATRASGPPHSRAGSTTTPRTTAFPRSTGGASRSRRTATASRSIPRRTTGSSTPTRSASPAATWRAASRTSPTGRSSRPAPASTRRHRTRTSSSTAIRRSTTCGWSGVAPATASSTDRRSGAT